MKKSVLILIIAIILVVCGVTGIASYFLIFKPSNTEITQQTTVSSVTETTNTEKSTKETQKKINKYPNETETETTKETQKKISATNTEKPTESATKKAEKAESNKKPNKDNIVLVLDAGHDSETHRRDHPNLGFSEQDLNLKIVTACYNELKKYDGVTVYLSRPDGDCPDAGDKYGDCITARTTYADSCDPDMFISFHCNASTGNLGASSNGAEVYVSKYPKYYSLSKELGEIIMKHITTDVDVAYRGVLTRSKPEKGYYDDGTVKDFYYLISNNVDNGNPGIIIEHAFMDNTHDNALLKQDEQLKKFGIADAKAIVEYYGLKLK